MMVLFDIFQNFWVLLFGAGGAFATLKYYSLNKRLKVNEVKSAEIDTLKITINMLRDELTAIQRTLIETRGLNSQLYGEKNSLEIKNSKLKSMINQAYACTYAEPKHCRVLCKQKELDDEWEKVLSNRVENQI